MKKKNGIMIESVEILIELSERWEPNYWKNQINLQFQTISKYIDSFLWMIFLEPVLMEMTKPMNKYLIKQTR